MDIFSETPHLVNDIYFWYSFIFFVIRTLGVLFSAASINDASRKPISILRMVPSQSYTVEVSFTLIFYVFIYLWIYVYFNKNVIGFLEISRMMPVLTFWN